jgi:hypothetical protein
VARPQKPIDWADVDKLCGLQCTEEEIAQFLGVSVDTLARRCQADHEMSFAEYFDQKRGVGRVSLRRSQWQLAQKGNATMLIWLGKQYLGQKDKSVQELSGIDGKPIQTSALSDLPEDLDARLTAVDAKIAAIEAKKNNAGSQ